MWKVLIVLAASLVWAGCGGGPLCVSTSAEGAFMDSCTQGNGNVTFCRCAWDELARRHTCEDFKNITLGETTDVAKMCQ